MRVPDPVAADVRPSFDNTATYRAAIDTSTGAVVAAFAALSHFVPAQANAGLWIFTRECLLRLTKWRNAR